MTRRLLVLLAASGCRSLLGFEELADPAAPDGSFPTDLTSDGAPIDDSDVPVQACPSTYTITIASSATVYRHVINVSVTWPSANDRCAMDHPNAHLVVLSSATELSQLQAQTGNAVRWVGISDRATDTLFIPVTDEPVAFPPASGPPWGVDEPMVGTADCVAVENNGELISLACGNGRQFICECDAFASDPTNF